MNLSDSVGESSSKRQENGDASAGTERPLKKARFAWQVKGKYHLKNETSESSRASISNSESDGAGPSTECKDSSNTFVGNTEQNLEILGDYLLKQDFNTLDSVITDTDKSLLTPSTRISTDTLQYPRYVCSYDNNRNSSTFTTNSSDSEHVVIPMSMVVSTSYCEDQCIARWQARQMAKGFVDNTINRVLDSWTHPPLPPDVNNSRFLALDVAEFINNLPGDNSIENEGILMAISAHGLQNTSNSSSDINSDYEEQNSKSSNKIHKFISPPNSPIHPDDGVLNIEPNNDLDIDEPPLADLLWINNDLKNESAMDQFALFPDTSSSCQYFSASGNVHNSSEAFDGDENTLSNHYDFMDAAVSFAIQNKGLTTFGTDYG